MGLTLREDAVEAPAWRMRARSALREAAEVAASPRTRATSVPRDSQEPVRRTRREGAETSARRAGSPVAWFDSERYGPDIWIEVAKNLSYSDLVRLSQTSAWLRRLITDDSTWRHILIHDLGLPATANQHTARPPHCSWRQLYRATFSGSHAFLRSNEELCGWRVGGFVLDAPEVLLTGTLPLPPTCTHDVCHSIRTRGGCVLTNARTGLWVADMQVTPCSGCTFRKCKGTIQVLDARHSDVLLDESLEYEKLGDYSVDEEVASAFCGIFNAQHVTSPSVIATVVTLKKWITERNIFKPRTCIGTHVVVVNSNLKRNKGTYMS